MEGYSSGIFFLSKQINFLYRFFSPLAYRIYKYSLISWGILMWWDIIVSVSYAIYPTYFGGSLWIEKVWLESVCAVLCVKNCPPTLEWETWAILFIIWCRCAACQASSSYTDGPNCSPLQNNYIMILSAFWLHAFLKSISWNC